MSELSRSSDLQGPVPETGRVPETSQISLVDLLDRLLGTGVVLAGDVLISLAGVDLVQVRLHALLTTVRADMPRPRHLQGDLRGTSRGSLGEGVPDD